MKWSKDRSKGGTKLRKRKHLPSSTTWRQIALLLRDCIKLQKVKEPREPHRLFSPASLTETSKSIVSALRSSKTESTLLFQAMEYLQGKVNQMVFPFSTQPMTDTAYKNP